MDEKISQLDIAKMVEFSTCSETVLLIQAVRTEREVFCQLQGEREEKFENYYWMDPLNKSIYDDSTITYDDNNINLQ